MGKNKSASGLTNFVQYDNQGNIFFVSGSNTLMSISSSGAITTTGVISGSNALSSSFALTASSVANLNQNVQITGSLGVTSTITAQTLVVQTVTSSIVYSSGSNVFGNTLSNTQQMTGSVNVTGSFSVATTGTELQVTNTGVRIGNVITDTHPITGSVSVSGSLTGVGATFSGQVEGTIINSTSNALRLSGNNAVSLVTLGGQSVVKINAAGFWGTQLVGANDSGILIGNTGNVLIGTTNTANGHKLEVNAGSQSALRIDVTSGTNAISMSPGAVFGIDKPGVGGGTFRITSNGNVGINQNNPQAAFQINGRGGADIIFQMNDESNIRRCFYIPNQYYGYMWAVGIVSNGGKAFSFGNQDGTEVGTIVINAGGVAYNTTSDYRLKEDLKDFNGLEKVSAIKVYDFKWKNLEERTNGVLAHELAEVLPYAVSGVKDALNHEGNIEAQSVDYSKLTPVLIKAIQELKTELDAAKAEIEILKTK